MEGDAGSHDAYHPAHPNQYARNVVRHDTTTTTQKVEV